MFKVNIKENKSFNVQSGALILDSAAQFGLYLPHSCRNGRCGACRVKLIAGSTEVIIPEVSLSENEIISGFILTCCRTASSDLVLDVENLSEYAEIVVKTLPCRIDKINYLARDVIHVVVRLPPASCFKYIEGQFVSIIARGGVKRSYSLSSISSDDQRLEFFIKKIDNGEMSHYWFNEAKVNDLLRINGPHGTFGLRSLNVDQIVFIATGTGIAPVKAIIEKMAKDYESYIHIEIYVYWGLKEELDLYWFPPSCGLNIHFFPVLSRPESNWRGSSGYVQDAVIADGVTFNSTAVYACGSDQMINSAYELFLSKGLNQDLFYSDAFVESN